ncbi:hypothetical protein CC1G_03749 [Coprinopsis cinerea okayama7|uniref:Uncharacterized protein n=1 Tax=Coprinopsis cinerea (strain Okayama-7 / 130 / ATCC MYA-4618 / FGSC 9003) TaxID=240176 RepID=A8N282_COPC7|nr:hypothetical protein CC1G_03749 [Coprinopsis cinerea okayama7\|eukprot:XP_001828955.2 hypothetical protein CC1G_03749 [Coprinopsis cinerea okayama7\
MPLPTMIRPVDRCWCDLTSGGFFQPFNVSNWEHQSVTRLKNELERAQAEVLASTNTSDASTPMFMPAQNDRQCCVQGSSPLAQWIRRLKMPSFKEIWSRHQAKGDANSDPQPEPEPPAPQPQHKLIGSSLSFLQRDFDLRPYGLDLIIDFSWSSERQPS